MGKNQCFAWRPCADTTSFKGPATSPRALPLGLWRNKDTVRCGALGAEVPAPRRPSRATEASLDWVLRIVVFLGAMQSNIAGKLLALLLILRKRR